MLVNYNMPRLWNPLPINISSGIWSVVKSNGLYVRSNVTRPWDRMLAFWDFFVPTWTFQFTPTWFDLTCLMMQIFARGETKPHAESITWWLDCCTVNCCMATTYSRLHKQLSISIYWKPLQDYFQWMDVDRKHKNIKATKLTDCPWEDWGPPL